MHVKRVLEMIKETRSFEAEVSARNLMRDVLVVPEALVVEAESAF